MSRAKTMRVEATQVGAPPKSIDSVERLRITVGRMQYRITVNDEGFTLTQDYPLGKVIAVVPHASNSIKIRAVR